MSAKPRVLITGGLGYLGTVLTGQLREHGFDPVVYDVGFFADCLLQPLEDEAWERRDARDITAADIAGFDAVIHLAAISNDPFGNLTTEQVYHPTREYAARIASLCRDLGKRFIFASSCSVYGVGDGSLLTEDAVPRPQTPYSLNKLLIEQDLGAMASETFRPIMFRFATAYGFSPRMRFDLYINMLVGMALTRGRIVLNSDGQAWRPNVHIRDICQALRLGLTHDVPSGGTILNVGASADNFRIIDVAQMICDAVPGCALTFMGADGCELSPQEAELIRDRKVQDGVDKRTYQVSFEKISREMPAFQCAAGVRDGIRELVSQLRTLGLTERELTNPRYYRLQQLERLYADGAVSSDLRWQVLA